MDLGDLLNSRFNYFQLVSLYWKLQEKFSAVAQSKAIRAGPLCGSRKARLSNGDRDNFLS